MAAATSGRNVRAQTHPTATRRVGSKSPPMAPHPLPTKDTTTGIVLAGGAGRRMGGLDKGLQPLNGLPLAAHALARLRPQVATLMLSANRHLAQYAALGAPVWPDEPAASGTPAFRGPLAGLLTGLRHCTTPWLLAVPCDVPGLPVDLATRLAAAVVGNVVTVQAATQDGDTPDGLRLHPACCLLHTSLAPSLTNYLAKGGRRVREWLGQQGVATVVFEDHHAFTNANTLEDLAALGR